MKLNPVFKDPYWQMAGLFVLIKFCLHLFTFNNYELHRDELLFFNQGAHVSFGNVSVPPFIGWVAFVIRNLFGYSVFGVRLIPMLLGALSVFVVAKIVKELGGSVLALLLASSAFVLSPGFLLFGSLFTVNIFDQFFWLVISYLFIRMVNSGNPKLWIWIGIAGGIAFLNKYLVLYLLAGFAIALLLSPQRKLFLQKQFVYAFIIGSIIISPNIYWQHTHGWPFFLQISELEKTQMVNMTYRNFIIDLHNLNYVSTFFWLGGFITVLLAKSEKKHRYLGIVSIVVIGLFMLSKGKAYHTLGLYPALFAVSGCLMEKYFTGKWRIINYLVWVHIVLFSCLSAPFSLPLLSFEKLGKYAEKTAGFVSYPFSRWEDGKIHPVSQVFSDMTGWEEMVGLVNQAYQQIPENERKNTTIYAERNYGYAGAVNFYGKKYHLPEAITFLESYVIWAPDTLAKGPLIYINYETAGIDSFFEKCTETGTVSNTYFRENGLKVFLCEKPNNQLQEVYKQKAMEEKKKFNQ